MSVEVAFNINGVNGVDFFSFPNAGYGGRDDNFRLTKLEEGEDTFIVYKKDRICRGFVVMLHGGHGHAYLDLPTSAEDIEIFYQYIKYLCDKVGDTTFILNGEEVSTEYISTYIQHDIKVSENILKEVQQVLESGEHQEFYVFGVMNPICLGLEQIQQIAGDLANFTMYMHNLQNQDIFYAGVQLYKNGADDSTMGILVVSEDCTTSLPDEPFLFNDEITVDRWIVGLYFDSGETKYISFDKLLANVDTSRRYDAKRFIVTLNHEEMEKIIEEA